MYKFKATLMQDADVKRALKRISHEIIERNNGCTGNICIVGVKRRGVPLSQMIAQNIYEIEGVKLETGEIDITFYRDDLSYIATEPVTNKSIDIDVDAKDIILVDDVLYTGRTVRAAMDGIMSIGRPESIQLAVLVDRGHRKLPIRGDYVGKNVPTSQSEFISVSLPPYEKDIKVEIYEIAD